MKKHSVITLTVSLAMSATTSFSADPPKSGNPSSPAFGDYLVDTKVFILPEKQAILRARFNAAWLATEDNTLESADHEVTAIPEFSIGLPGRFQFSLSQESVKVTGESWENAAVFPEMRWAIAPWGNLPLNPTLALGYEFVSNDDDVLKASLFLAEEFSNARWLWASNFTYQKRIGGDDELELIAKMGSHYVLSPTRLAIGLEGKFEYAETYGDDPSTAKELLAGPAIIWHPMDQITVRAGSYFGMGLDSPDNETTVALEWAF